jgi:hypothetical protein
MMAIMSALANIRHETFAQLIAQAPKRGLSNAECYRQAGYRVAAGPACDVSASRLLSSDKVQARIAELIEPTVRKTRATVDSLASQFDRVFDGALGAEQFGAAGNAAGLKARLLGFMKEKIEIGAPGDFASCETIEQIVDKLLDQQSPADALLLLDQFRDLIEQRAANLADIVDAPLVPQASNEAAKAIELFRPARKSRR